MRAAALALLALAPQARGTELRASWGYPTHLDPHRAASPAESRAVLALFEGLTTRAADGGAAAPGMAEAWDADANGLVWTFRLREAAWSDGEPVRAEDFVYAWRRALRPGSGCEHAPLFRVFRNVGSYLDAQQADALLVQYDDFSKEAQADAAARLASIGRRRHADALRRRGRREAALAAEGRPDVEEKDLGFAAIDARTLRVTVERRTPWLPDLLASPAFVPLPARAVEAHGAGWVRPDRIVTNGAYLFERATPVEIAFRRHARYWDRQAEKAPDRIVIEFSSEEVAVRKFREGKLDWVAPEQVPAGSGGAGAAVAETWGAVFLRLNVSRAPFDRPGTRAAFARAVDRRAVSEAAGGKPSERLVPPGLPGYAAPPGLSFDKAAAMEALLRESGFEVSKVPPVEILANDAPGAARAADAVREQWEKNLGVRVRVRTMKWPAYLRALAAGEFQAALAGWIGDVRDPAPFLEPWTRGHAQNVSGWEAEAFDGAVRAASETASEEERLRHLARAEGLLLEAAPLVPLYTPVETCLAAERVSGVLGRTPLKHVRLR
jgi:oligopeptide transport system substrate-binding protein